MKLIYLSKFIILLVLGLLSSSSIAIGPMRPPPFAAGIPGLVQMQSIIMQRHQARTLRYREALEELHKNPTVADVPNCSSTALSSESLCLRLPKSEIQPPAAIKKIRRYQALLFGNNAYQYPIPVLDTPIGDVEETAEVLRVQFGYDTQVIHDATKMRIIQEMNKVAEKVSPEDSVLLFYAGHGYLDDVTNMGYWIPVDASVKTAANWISNNDIAKLLHAIPANQLILISDSCFSGSLTREQKFTMKNTATFGEILNRRSVIAFSSGDEEPVSDEGKDNHSIFAWNLINTLKRMDSITPGYEVYQIVYNGIKQGYSQSPQYGAVITSGHVSGGEYLFKRKN